MSETNEQQTKPNTGPATDATVDSQDDAAPGDGGKTDAELWAEFDRAEGAAPGDTNVTASPDDESGDGQDEDVDTGAATDGDGTPADGSATRTEGAEGASGDGRQASGGTPPPDGAAGTAQDDPWAKATPELRSAFEAERTKWEDRDRRTRGQVSALQREINELKRSRTAAPANGAADGKGSGKSDGDDTADGIFVSDEWKTFEQEYPEVSGPIGKLIRRQEQTIQSLRGDVSAITSDRREADLDEQEELLAEQHADWQTVAEHPSLGSWLETQPRHIREAAARNAEFISDAAEAADVIGRFKAHLASQPATPGNGTGAQGGNGAPAAGNGGQGKQNPPLSGKRQRQLESASSTRSGGPGAAFGIPEDGDPETLWKQWERYDEQQARAQGA